MSRQSIPQKFFCQLLAIVAATIGFCACFADAGLIHRYSFQETGTVKDSAGNADGDLKGATVTNGALTLKNDGKNSGDDDVQYVAFTKPILPKSGSVSLVFWFTASDAPAFSRILDLGDQDNSEGQAFIYFTPRDSDDQSRAAITASDAASKTSVDNDRLDDGKQHMVAIVVDGNAKKLHVFVDGKESAAPADLGDNTLDKVSSKHAWIGRSAFDNDPGLSATINEFRVYDNALGGDDVAAAYKAGPGALPGATTQK